MWKKIFVLFLAAALLGLAACAPAPTPSTPIVSDEIVSIVEQYRPKILSHMQQENIPGLAIAVVDDQHLLWAEGFGYTDRDKKIPVTPNTLFSIQSMSKSFTATAAMFAAQDGLVDLDEPITTYLPDFHVNSIFEERPEQKITMRMLLSHTAGFVHEAPYGGNFDHPPYSFEKHIASISDTWLKFPVGTRYSYSNLGIDLAGYILQVRSGIPFTQYVQEKVLNPIGMKDSTLEIDQIRANSKRAVGHSSGNPLHPPVDFLIIPSGGVWTTAADMARYLQFHINEGASDGTRLLGEELAETMYTPPNVPAHDYALGVVRTIEHGTRQFEHGGGGFGFNSDMIWYPELKLGAVVLCNTELESNLVYQLNKEILDSIIASAPDVYAERAKNEPPAKPAYPPDMNGTVLSDAALRELIAGKATLEDTSTEKERDALVGTYVIAGLDDTAEIRNLNGTLTMSYWGTTDLLTEVEHDLYFSPYGETVDFRNRVPTYSNIRLSKIDRWTGVLYITFYVLCGLVFLSVLFHKPMGAMIRRIQRKRRPVDTVTANPRRDPWLIWTEALSVLASLFSLLLLILIALLPNMVYILAAIPMMRPYVDLLWWQFALLSLPFVNLLIAAVIALLLIALVRSNRDRRLTRLFYPLVVVALLAFNLTIVI